MLHSLAQAVSIKKWKTSAVSTTDLIVETQLCKLRGALDVCFIYDMVFVNYTWLRHKFYGRSFARVQPFGNCHAGRILVAQCTRLQALSMCLYEKQEQIGIFFLRLINCYCSCRKLYVDQRVSTGVLVPRRRWGAGAHCWIFSNRRAPRTARRIRRC